MASFGKPEACGQTVLPDRSVLIGQKLVKNAKVQKLKWDILSNFQTMFTVWNNVLRKKTFASWSEAKKTRMPAKRKKNEDASEASIRVPFILKR